MSWVTVARHDYAKIIRERSVRLLLGLLGTVLVLAGYVYPIIGTEPYTTARFGRFATSWLSTTVPLVGILLGYNAVVGERESGAIRLLLSLPTSRRELVLGLVASRAGLVAATTAAGALIAGVLVIYPFGELVLGRFLLFVLLVVVFGAVWTSLGIAISATVTTRRRALVFAVALFVLFVVLWDAAASALELGLNAAGLLDGNFPPPLQFVVSLQPGTVFERATAGFVVPSTSVDGPWFMGPWVALVVLAAWVVSPLWLATRRFDQSDLT
jgi:ABC-type transport system involved in multi-copper enzyme maturation permease subunit